MERFQFNIFQLIQPIFWLFELILHQFSVVSVRSVDLGKSPKGGGTCFLNYDPFSSRLRSPPRGPSGLFSDPLRALEP